MRIIDGIRRVATEYLAAKTQPLRDHPLAALLRDTLPKEISEAINSGGSPQPLIVQGTKSPGNWAGVPWIGIRDPRLTDGIQRGVYGVILFAEDMHAIFLCIGMGITETPNETIEKWLMEIQREFSAPDGFSNGPLESGSIADRGKGAEYEETIVYFKEYAVGTLPTEEELRTDLRSLSNLLRSIGDSGRYRIASTQHGSSATAPAGPRNELCLLGTWRGLNDVAAERVKTAIASRGGWASWWSFPIREEFHAQLEQPFFIYLNAGGGSMTFRMKVERFKTARGNVGIPSPWPELTDPDDVGKVRSGPTNADIFKTWLQVRSIEKLNPALSLDAFEPAGGTPRTALLNQSAFGYAYPKQAVATNNVREIPGSRQSESRPADIQTPINLILYGPPGTGKTHWLRKKFDEYTDTPSSVDNETWLQELLADYGWREVIAAALADLRHPARVPEIRENRWVIAKKKQRARTTSVNATLWRYLQGHTPESVTTVNVSDRRPPFIFSKGQSGEWSLLGDWAEQDDAAAALVRSLADGPTSARRPIRRYRVVTFHPSFSYEDFVRGIRPVADADDDSVQFRLVDGVFKEICDEARGNPAKRYALFIDEINRANIAKVFGELITLIEPDKRAVFDSDGALVNGMVVQLAGGEGGDVVEPAFGVPSNLDIFGTMNTADRSIALLDVALRRRFEFQEMGPDYGTIDREIDSIHLGALLQRVNDRLEYLLDRDHRIGHAYLMGVNSLPQLRRAFRVQIIPLLQEYFFDDLAKVAAVLATDNSAPSFVAAKKLAYGVLFSGSRLEAVKDDRSTYVITGEATWTQTSFRGIYAPSNVETAVDESM